MNYLTDFEKMMLDFISENRVVQYSDEESFKVFQEINKGVDNDLIKSVIFLQTYP